MKGYKTILFLTAVFIFIGISAHASTQWDTCFTGVFQKTGYDLQNQTKVTELPACCITCAPDCLCRTDTEVIGIDVNGNVFSTFDCFPALNKKLVYRTKTFYYDVYTENQRDSKLFSCIWDSHGSMNLNAVGYGAKSDPRYTDILLC